MNVKNLQSVIVSYKTTCGEEDSWNGGMLAVEWRNGGMANDATSLHSKLYTVVRKLNPFLSPLLVISLNRILGHTLLYFEKR